MAFFAWDGSSGEHGSRMAVSTWYFLALDRPTPPGVFISPVLAMLVTLTLGLVVVRRAPRAGAFRGTKQHKNTATPPKVKGKKGRERPPQGEPTDEPPPALRPRATPPGTPTHRE